MQISQMLYGMLPIRRVDTRDITADADCLTCGGPGSGRHASGQPKAQPDLHKALLKSGFRLAGTEMDSKHLGMFRNKNRALYRNPQGHEVTTDTSPNLTGWKHYASSSNDYPANRRNTSGDNVQDWKSFQQQGHAAYEKSKGLD